MRHAPAYTPEQHERIHLGLHFARDGAQLTVRVVSKLVALNATPLRVRVEDEIAEGVRHLVIDLSECEDVSAHGFGVLVALANLARRIKGGGTCTILRANHDVRALFTMHGIDRLFAFDASEEAS